MFKFLEQQFFYKSDALYIWAAWRGLAGGGAVKDILIRRFFAENKVSVPIYPWLHPLPDSTRSQLQRVAPCAFTGGSVAVVLLWEAFAIDHLPLAVAENFRLHIGKGELKHAVAEHRVAVVTTGGGRDGDDEVGFPGVIGDTALVMRPNS